MIYRLLTRPVSPDDSAFAIAAGVAFATPFLIYHGCLATLRAKIPNSRRLAGRLGLDDVPGFVASPLSNAVVRCTIFSAQVLIQHLANAVR
jgi:hypothetical protein